MKTLEECQEIRAQMMERFYQAYPFTLGNIALQQVANGPIEFSDQMRTTTGRAFYSKSLISLNTRLLSENPDHFEKTFIHELAHLISFAVYGQPGRGHGKYWKHIMRLLGQEPERCHDLDTSGFKRNQRVLATAACACREWDIKSVRLRRMRAGAKYRCLTCKNPLQLINKGGA